MLNIHSIKTKLILAVATVMTGAFLFQSLFLSPRIEKANIDGARKAQEAIADQLAEGLNATFQSAASELKSMAGHADIRSLDRGRMDRAIRAFNTSNRFFNYYFVMDREGRWLSYPTRPENVGERIPRKNMGWVERTFTENRTVFLDVVQASIGSLVSGFSTPIPGEEGRPSKALLRGVLTVSGDNTLIRFLRKVQFGERGCALMISSNGWLLAHPRMALSPAAFERFDFRDHRPAMEALQGRFGTMEYDQHMVAFRPVPITGWAILVQQPMKDILAAARGDARMGSLIFLVTFALTLIVMVFVVQVALRPLAALLQEIETGKVGRKSRIYPRDEIGCLARRFNEIYTKLFASREQLGRSEEKFRALFNNTNDGLIIHDLDGRILEVNRVACERMGYDRPSFLRLNLSRFDSPAAASRIQDRIRIIQEKGHLLFESEHITSDGQVIPVEINARLMDFEGRHAILSVVRDLSERKEAERALLESEEKYRLLVEASPFAIVMVGTNHRIQYLNPRFVEVFGYTLDDISTVREWFEKAYPEPGYRKEVIEFWERDQHAVRPDDAAHRTFSVRCRDGSDKEVHFRLAQLETGEQLTFLEDVTDRKRLEVQFLQSQKMEALGTLAGGIAHDFNNLLMGIQGRVSLLLSEPGISSSHQDHLQGIETYVKSASDLTRQLLGIARGGKYEVQPTDINRLVQTCAEMFGRTHKEIRLHFKLEEDLPWVEVDQGQMEQVLLNLFVNAWQAMPSGGEMHLETEGLVLEPSEVTPHDAVPGRYVRLSVTDTGAGMDKDIQGRIFDPFFTTKGLGHGTGLGLASAYGIVKNHNGFIRVDSEKGHGATFSVYLPETPERSRKTEQKSDGVVRGSGLVLLVDDEEMILEVGAQLLDTLGYDVVLARNGEEAVREVRERAAEIDLVVLDMIMPDQGGGETFDRLKALAPKIRVILSSGYSLDGEAAEIMNRGCLGFIQKPFNLAMLSQKIAEALKDREGTPAAPRKTTSPPDGKSP